MSSKGRVGSAFGVVGAGLLLIRLFVETDRALRYPDGAKVLGIALLIVAVIAVPWFAWVFHRARTFKARLQQDHPGALIVDTFWTPKELGRFLKKGFFTAETRGLGFILDVVADSRGIELVREGRRPVYFGLVPWDHVIAVQMEEFRKPLGRRPLLILEVDSWNTPYVAAIRLLPSGRQNRESGAALAELILAQRPRELFRDPT